MTKILIAEDEPVSRTLLEATLDQWGMSYVSVPDAETALASLEADRSLKMLLIDWKLPGLSGVELCRKIRQQVTNDPPYIILVTAEGSPEKIVTGLQSGADDYVVKPYYSEELRARIGVGLRLLAMQESLNRRVVQLETALNQVHELQGLIPICSYCKKVRDDKNYWQQVEGYISARTTARFSHGVCPPCLEKAMQEIRGEKAPKGSGS